MRKKSSAWGKVYDKLNSQPSKEDRLEAEWEKRRRIDTSTEEELSARMMQYWDYELEDVMGHFREYFMEEFQGMIPIRKGSLEELVDFMHGATPNKYADILPEEFWRTLNGGTQDMVELRDSLIDAGVGSPAFPAFRDLEAMKYIMDNVYYSKNTNEVRVKDTLLKIPGSIGYKVYDILSICPRPKHGKLAKRWGLRGTRVRYMWPSDDTMEIVEEFHIPKTVLDDYTDGDTIDITLIKLFARYI